MTKQKQGIEEKIRHLIKETFKGLSLSGLPSLEISLEFPADFAHGDYSSNIALVLGKQLKKNPRELADQIVAAIQKNLDKKDSEKISAGSLPEIAKVEVAGPGFINFHLSKQFFADEIAHILKAGQKYGRNDAWKGKKILIEYTDPNPFKAFHIGHLMSNAIGESLSRLLEATGAKLKRANYQGDVGLHVAKAIYGMQLMKTEMPSRTADKETIVGFLGNAYATGSKLYEHNEDAKAKIHEINRKVYERSDKDINKLYDIGRKWSLEHFEQIYALLGTRFDYYFFESEVAEQGKKIVEQHVSAGTATVSTADASAGVFEQSEGATVFKGEKFALHTRVFITKEGIPTYEAKEIALNKSKFDKVHPDLSITVTAEEQREYFRVVMKALELIFPEIAARMKHISHGMLVLPTGKMSSHTGDVITGESLIKDTVSQVKEKMLGAEKQKSVGDEKAQQKVAEQVAIGAIKYMLLRQSPGKNIVYDMEKSLSLEGDSGPYLQYSVVRANSVLEKAAKMKIKPSVKMMPVKIVSTKIVPTPFGQTEPLELEKIIARFPHIVAHAQQEYSPNDITTYLIQLASAFNSFYAKEQIASDAPDASYKVALTAAFAHIMQNGLWLLGIETPERM